MSDIDFGTLNSRIDKIEVTLSHAVDAIEKIANVVNAPKETNWGVIASWVSVLLGIGLAVYVPISNRMGNNTDDIKFLEAQMLDVRSTRWSQADHDRYEERVRDEIHRLEDHINQLMRDIHNQGNKDE